MPARFLRSLRSHPGRAVALLLAALLSAGAVVAAFGGGRSPGTGVAQRRSAPDAAQTTVSTAPGGLSYDSRQEAKEALRPAGGAGDAPMAAAVPASPAPLPPAGGIASSASGDLAAVAPGSGPQGLGGPPLPQAVAAGTARIVKTAAVELKLDKGRLAGIEQQALDVVSAAGGWVQSSDMGADQAHLVLKVPSDRLDGVVSSLKKLGKVRSESMAGEDVTAQYVDLEARLTHWRAQESVFLGLMARAKTIPETIQIQQQLSQIQEQIEQLEGQRRYLEGQTTFSTIRLGLLEGGAVAKQPEKESPTILAQAWERAAGAALAVLGGTLVVLGAVVPLTFILGIPTLLVLAALRRRSGVVVPPV